MAMGGAANGRVSPNVNVTPLIDILLVLIIIFMVIQPHVSQGLEALVPQAPKSEVSSPPSPGDTIVLQVLSGDGGLPVYSINQHQVDRDQVTPALAKIFAARQEKVMFVQGGKDLSFGDVAEAIGFGKAAEVANIGILTPGVEAGR